MSCSDDRAGLRANSIEVRIVLQTLCPTRASTSLSARFELFSPGGRRDISVKTCNAISKGRSGNGGIRSGFVAILRIRSGLGEVRIDMLLFAP